MRWTEYNIYPFLGEKNHLLQGSLDEGKSHSMTLDPHKMMSIPIPTGGIVYQNKKLIEEISFPIPYLGEEAISTTISGTRPGAGMMALRAMLLDPNYGWDYYRSVVKRCHNDAWVRKNVCSPLYRAYPAKRCSFIYNKS